MEKGFFKVFNPETSAKRMKIPTGHTNYKNGKLPRNVFLRDRFNNIWPMGVTRIGRDLYFQYGWEKFIEDNTLEFGDFIIFDYDGNGTFDFKLLGITGCVKEGAKCEKKEKVSVEHRKSAELKEKNRTRDNNDSSFDDDNTDNYMIEEEDNDKVEVEKEEMEDDDEEGAEKEIEEEVEEGKNDETEEEVEEDETEEEEDEEENGTTNTFKKKTSSSKAITCKVRNTLDRYGADIFKSGRATQPKNPYFVAKILPKRRNQLYVPIDVVRDYKLELPPSMIIRDSAGREFETRVNNWKDGRIWLMGGWRSICRWNLVEESDRCICEFVRGKSGKILFLQVQVLREGSNLP
ncbi:B3 domain-containing protein At5g60140-like [Solanum verrucosum]|uniref:B3 domain-containing protein At5g60140-like n=1 Tax=Solanum verrucosum TaxID=315347 RepID=UPI0020D12EFD|nr:B3 domain-containing protein At5g60140-like [Solanum verrucosum]